MSWNTHHSASEGLAIDAERASRAGDKRLAEGLYRKAAEEEAAALEDLGTEKLRTRGITAVSAVSLWYKARDYATAEGLAYRCLSVMDHLPSFAHAQLRNLLSMIWTASAAERAGVNFVPGDVLVSVQGTQIIHGAAPLELIIQKVEGVRALLFRTIEMLLGAPLRIRGGPTPEVQSMFRPWLFQAPAGSYQFAVRMQEPEQREFWESNRPKVEQVTKTFLGILRASATDPDGELPRLVPDQRYRRAFLDLSRNLAPTGKTYDRIEIRDASSPAEPVVTFGVESRQELNTVIKQTKMTPADNVEESETIVGVLRALDLDHDWLTVVQSDSTEHVRIDDAGEVLDDVIGPMVNHRVKVFAVRRGSKHIYRDIDVEE